MRTIALILFLVGLAISLFGIAAVLWTWSDPIHSEAIGPILMGLGFVLFLRSQSNKRKFLSDTDILDSDL